ncbi:aldo/keto reductase [Salinigranum halophilum]|uniref:aldo/keto reductase n=1 Tax=Salinigranum halophilum TaxID=2565931 RepID=UPI0010A7ED1E|nr:aldo/keto reductase [Salinigranum halophilum]
MTLELPDIGLGTYRMTDRDECVRAVETALDAGYRHVDTAQMYDNESFVGEGLANAFDAGGSRDDVVVATKLDTDNTGYDAAVSTAHESRERLGLDAIDLLYVHWPLEAYRPDETLPALDDLVDDGVVSEIGLSNFLPSQLEAAIDRLDHDLFAHQVEMHPLLQQRELHELANEHDHYLVAYCPIARNQVADVDVLQEVADAHDATPAQVSLAWLASKENVVPIPKASSPDHIRENFAAMDLELAPAEVERIDALDGEVEERIVDFPSAPWNQA